jgi:site-specific recombinase XerD
MKEQENFTTRFFARKSRGAKTGKSLLLVRVTVNSKRMEITLKKELPSTLWDEKAQKCKGNSQLAGTLNKTIETARRSLYNIEQRLVLEGKRPTAEIVKARFNGLPDPDEIPNPTVLQLYDEHNEKFTELLGTKNHSVETLKKHKVSKRHVTNFIQSVYKVEDLSFERVDYRFLSDFDHYLKSVRKCNQNSSMKYIRNVGKIINQAHAEGYMQINPFSKFKLHFDKVRHDPLTEKEVKAIMSLELDERLEKIRDVFVFCIYTGLAFVDIESLTMDDIHEGKEESLWINKNRNKTEVEFLIPVLPIPKALMGKYKDHPLRATRNLVMPVISNQKYNAYLKEIAVLAKIKKKLTTHLARHTFATTITLENGVPIEVVSKMLGHSSIRTTQIYAQVQERLIKNSMGGLMKDDTEKKKRKKDSKKKKKKKGGKQND